MKMFHVKKTYDKKKHMREPSSFALCRVWYTTMHQCHISLAVCTHAYLITYTRMRTHTHARTPQWCKYDFWTAAQHICMHVLVVWRKINNLQSVGYVLSQPHTMYLCQFLSTTVRLIEVIPTDFPLPGAVHSSPAASGAFAPRGPSGDRRCRHFYACQWPPDRAHSWRHMIDRWADQSSALFWLTSFLQLENERSKVILNLAYVFQTLC